MELQPGQRIVAPFLSAPADVSCLAMEAHRLRLVYQFDPCVSLSLEAM